MLDYSAAYKYETPYLLTVIFKGTWEYLMTISGGLKYLTEEISFRKNYLHHLTPHVRISHIPHI